MEAAGQNAAWAEVGPLQYAGIGFRCSWPRLQAALAPCGLRPCWAQLRSWTESDIILKMFVGRFTCIYLGYTGSAGRRLFCIRTYFYFRSIALFTEHPSHTVVKMTLGRYATLRSILTVFFRMNIISVPCRSVAVASGNMPDCRTAVWEDPGSNLTTGSCLSLTATAIYSFGHGLHTLTAVHRSTQPTTLCGTVKWVSALRLSNNKKNGDGGCGR